MSNIIEHIRKEFDNSLPQWIDKSSVILTAIKEAVLSHIDYTINDYETESDFLTSDKAKAVKQQDYSIRLRQQEASLNFKDKYKILFRRGSQVQLNELEMFLNNANLQYLPLEPSATTPIQQSNSIRITKSTEIQSGWIADVSFPSINEETTPEAPEKFEFVFSEEAFLLVELVNRSEFSNSRLKEILLNEYLPFAIPSIIMFKQSLV